MKKLKLIKIFLLLLLFIITSFSSVGLCAYIGIYSPDNNSWHKGGSKITLAASGSASYTIRTFVIYVEDSDGNELVRNIYNPALRTSVDLSFSWTIPSGYGEYIMEAFMIYGPQYSSETDSITFFAENDTPSLSLISPTSGTWYRSGATVPITVTGSDPSSGIDKIEIYIDNTKVKTFDLTNEKNYTGTYNWTATTTGSHSIYAKIYDNVGYTQTSETRYVYVDSSNPIA